MQRRELLVESARLDKESKQEGCCFFPVYCLSRCRLVSFWRWHRSCGKHDSLIAYKFAKICAQAKSKYREYSTYVTNVACRNFIETAMGSALEPPLSSLKVTHVFYDPSDPLSLLFAYMALIPQGLMVIYVTVIYARREIEIVLMLVGQLLSEAANWVLKRVIKEDRPPRS